MRIDYCQDDTYKYCPDNSFSDEVWKTLFEYDASLYGAFYHVRIALLNGNKGTYWVVARHDGSRDESPTIEGRWQSC